VLEATKLASEIDVEPLFEFSVGRVRARHVRRHFDYENVDEPIIDPITHFKANYFYYILDVAINSSNLQLLLTDGVSVDINGLEMADELKSLIPMIESNLTPVEILKFVINTGDFAPNVLVALRILLTLPVTVASGE
jgi:hypothetical protein